MEPESAFGRLPSWETLPRPRSAEQDISRSRNQPTQLTDPVETPGSFQSGPHPSYNAPTQFSPIFSGSTTCTPAPPSASHGFVAMCETLWKGLSVEELYKACYAKEVPRDVSPQEPDPADFPGRDLAQCEKCKGSGKVEGLDKECKTCEGLGECVRVRQHKDAERERRAWHKFYQDLMHVKLPDQLIIKYGFNQKQGPTKQQILEASVVYIQKLLDLNDLQAEQRKALADESARKDTTIATLRMQLARNGHHEQDIPLSAACNTQNNQFGSARSHLPSCRSLPNLSSPLLRAHPPTAHCHDYGSTSPPKRRKRTRLPEHQDVAAGPTFDDGDGAPSLQRYSGTTVDALDQTTPTRLNTLGVRIPSPFDKSASSDCGSSNGTDSSWEKLSVKSLTGSFS